MNSSQEFDLEEQHPQIDPIPVNPNDSFPSQLNFQYAAPGIVNVLDPLPGEDGGFSFHTDQRPQHEEAQDLCPREETATDLQHTNDTNMFVQDIHQGNDDGWRCSQCGADILCSNEKCSSCEGWKNNDHVIDSTQEHIADNDMMMTQHVNRASDRVDHSHIDRTMTQTINRAFEGEDRSRNQMMTNSVNYGFNSQQWVCDKCGQSNAYNKVRCNSCSRWKDGKRPSMKMAAPILASNLIQPDAATLAAVSALGKWICHGCSVINHKSRCRICQRWKGGRRHNLPKRKSNPDTTQQGFEITQWTCKRCKHMNEGAKSRCGSCQHWKDGKRLNMRAKSSNESTADADALVAPPEATANTQPQAFNAIDSQWQCGKCATINDAPKRRCKLCQSWKNCKRQQQYQKEMTIIANNILEPVTTQPWVCIECNYTNNTPDSQRCDVCHCYKSNESLQQHQISNGDNQFYSNACQMNQQDHSVAAVPIEIYQVPPNAYPPGVTLDTSKIQAHEDPMQQSSTWNCPYCNRGNLAFKTRCGGCQKWKGGVRRSYKKRPAKVLAEPWNCHRCNLQNAGNRVRCKTCQCWKDGGRPDVLVRKAMIAEARKIDSWWPCDKCNRPNKPRSQRCGNCQRWRGGSRPQMKRQPASFIQTVTMPNQEIFPHESLPANEN